MSQLLTLGHRECNIMWSSCVWKRSTLGIFFFFMDVIIIENRYNTLADTLSLPCFWHRTLWSDCAIWQYRQAFLIPPHGSSMLLGPTLGCAALIPMRRFGCEIVICMQALGLSSGILRVFTQRGFFLGSPLVRPVVAASACGGVHYHHEGKSQIFLCPFI